MSGYIPVDKRRAALQMLADGVAPARIAEATELSLRSITHWAKLQRAGNCSEGMLRAEAGQPKPLCLVDGCYDARTHGKFCRLHAPHPPAGVPLNRLMAGR